jgi:hypothetical protein
LQKTTTSYLYFFIIAWFIINLVQSYFTELTSDEGYYWFYSTSLQWGYYDHPPMVALAIKLGTLLFKGELGVRFINVCFSTGSFILLYKLLDTHLIWNKRSILIALSIPLITYLAFIVFPDGPLIFFSLLYLVFYKNFLQKASILNAVLLGLSMALMLYSKYHGVLIIFFTVVANIKLLRTIQFYIAGIVGLILFLPHLIWQYQHHFITFGYHLSGRTDPLTTRHIFEYISQQIPAIGLGVFFIPFVYKTTNLFERTLKTIIIGTFIFFLFSSLKTFVHFHWTSITLFPILYFAIKYYNDEKHKKLFQFLIIPFVIIIAVARLMLALPVLPMNHANVDYYHGRDKWAEDIKSLASGKPVVFANNLRETALYSFYSGQFAVTFYGREEKKSQYDLWNYEDSIQGKDVLFVSLDSFASSFSKITRMGEKVFYTVIPSFQSFFNHLPINATIIHQDDPSVQLNIEIKNERNYTVGFSKNKNGQFPSLIYSIEKDQNTLKADTVSVFGGNDRILPGSFMSINGSIPLKGLPAGTYDLYLGIQFGVLPAAFNSNLVHVTVRR